MDGEDNTIRWMRMTPTEHVATVARIMAANGPLELAQLHATLAIAKGGTTAGAVEAFLDAATA
jgi:hypothetical protein